MHKRVRRILLGVVIAIFGLSLFPQITYTDDAFISYRYAKNLAEGHGLVYNPGDPPVEGYTNGLWTYALAGLHLFPVDITLTMRVVGVLLYVIALVCTYILGKALLKREFFVIALVIIVGSNSTLRAFASSGLESLFLLNLLLIFVLL